MTSKRKDFGGVSGHYSLELIIGDASISNPLTWQVAEVVFSFPEGSQKIETQDFTYKVKKNFPIFLQINILYLIYYTTL